SASGPGALGNHADADPQQCACKLGCRSAPQGLLARTLSDGPRNEPGRDPSTSHKLVGMKGLGVGAERTQARRRTNSNAASETNPAGAPNEPKRDPRNEPGRGAERTQPGPVDQSRTHCPG